MGYKYCKFNFKEDVKMIHRVGRRIKIRICERCNKEIKNRRIDAKYCKDCAKFFRDKRYIWSNAKR